MAVTTTTTISPQQFEQEKAETLQKYNAQQKAFMQSKLDSLKQELNVLKSRGPTDDSDDDYKTKVRALESDIKVLESQLGIDRSTENIQREKDGLFSTFTTKDDNTPVEYKSMTPAQINASWEVLNKDQFKAGTREQAPLSKNADKLREYGKFLEGQKAILEEELKQHPDDPRTKADLNDVNRKLIAAKAGTQGAVLEAERYNQSRTEVIANQNIRQARADAKEDIKTATAAAKANADLNPEVGYTIPLLSEFIQSGKTAADKGLVGGFKFKKALIEGIKEAKQGVESVHANYATQIHDILVDKAKSNSELLTAVEKEFLEYWKNPDRKASRYEGVQDVINKKEKTISGERAKIKISRQQLEAIEHAAKKGERIATFEHGTDASGNSIIGMKVSGGGAQAYRVFLKPVKIGDQYVLRAYTATARDPDAKGTSKAKNWVQDYVGGDDLTTGHLGGNGYPFDPSDPKSLQDAILKWKEALEGTAGKIRTNKKEVFTNRVNAQTASTQETIEKLFNGKTLPQIVDEINAKPEPQRTFWEKQFINRTKANQLKMLNDLGAAVSTAATGNKVLFTHGEDLPEGFEPEVFLGSEEKAEIRADTLRRAAEKARKLAEEGKNGWHFEIYPEDGPVKELRGQQVPVKELKRQNMRTRMGKDGLMIVEHLDDNGNVTSSQQLVGIEGALWAHDNAQELLQEAKRKQIADYTSGQVTQRERNLDGAKPKRKKPTGKKPTGKKTTGNLNLTSNLSPDVLAAFLGQGDD